MKKLMIALALVACGLVSEAAVAKWNVTNLYTPSATQLSPGSESTPVGTKIAKGTAIAVDFFYLTQPAVGSGTVAEWVKLDSKSALPSTAPSDGTTVATQFWTEDSVAFKALLDAENVEFKVEITYGDYTLTATQTKDISNLANANQNVAFNMNGATWTTSIPEPTSGMLLLLGVAGLALKRRRA